jgi:hypothetical protein
MKRRTFLKEAVIVPALVAASEWYASAEAIVARPARITAVLYDERYVDCRVFAKALEREGAMSFATRGDAATVWYGALRQSRARTRGSVAGMVTHSDWVVSRACGREQGLRVAYEGSHDWRVSDRLIHRLHGDGLEREVYCALLQAETSWSEAVASGLVRSLRRNGVRLAGWVAIGDAVRTGPSTGRPGYLTSWRLDPSAFF